MFYGCNGIAAIPVCFPIENQIKAIFKFTAIRSLYLWLVYPRQ